MDNKRILLIILLIKQTLATIYYSQTAMNYNDSVSFCENRGGRLLQYGELFVNGVRDCESSNELLIVWTGHPHFNKLGCIEDSLDRVSVSSDANEFAKCADFCEGARYSHIGISDKLCTCYIGEPPLIQYCNDFVKCPGNPAGQCGQGEIYSVYAKVYNTTCRSRFYPRLGASGQEAHAASHDNTCPRYLAKFFCKVGNDTDLVCDIDGTLTTQELPVSTTLDHIEESISSIVTEKPTVELVTTREQTFGQNNCTVFWILAIAFAIITTGLNVAFFLYNRKKYTDACKRSNNTLYTTPIARIDEHCYESPRMNNSEATSNTQATKSYENVKETKQLNQESDQEYIEIF